MGFLAMGFGLDSFNFPLVKVARCHDPRTIGGK